MDTSSLRRVPDHALDAVDAGYRRLVRPVLFRSGGGDAERAHEATLRMLAAADRPGVRTALRRLTPAPRRPVELAGIRFGSRLGLAAGMDKDGRALAAWPALGFGHVELGTVTGRAQPGNPRPRLFRLPEQHALINRMGFNNAGADALAARLRDAGPIGVPVGVSIGKTKAVPVQDAVADYLHSLTAVDGLADYVAVNVSSPNTPGLRSLQDAGPLAELIGALTARAAELAAARSAAATPVLVKVAPDLTDPALDELVDVVRGAGAAGLIATNTTIGREGLPPDLPVAAEAGGLSGAPLARRARHVVHRLAASGLPVIGVGGVDGPDDARALLDAGARLVQVYSGFVYGGPAWVRRVRRAVDEERS